MLTHGLSKTQIFPGRALPSRWLLAAKPDHAPHRRPGRVLASLSR